MKINAIHQGDNLQVMREIFADQSVDLAYLDPPFKSNRRYGLQKGKNGNAFDDVWRWDEKAEEACRRAASGKGGTARAIDALVGLLGKGEMAAYLCMMAPRLDELKRILKPGGALYLHCDPHTSHYLKILLDAAFGTKNFNNELVWHYRRWTNAQRRYQKMHDTILFYRNGKGGAFNPPSTRPTASQAAVIERGWNVNKVKDGGSKILQLLVYDRDKFQRAVEEGRLDPARYGRVIYRDSDTSALSDTWTDIQYLHSQAKERLGWPTQKPEQLLERIVKTSSNPGDLVLDPFCGSGTTLVAAARLKRKWVGIELSPRAADMAAKRIQSETGKPVKIISH